MASVSWEYDTDKSARTLATEWLITTCQTVQNMIKRWQKTGCVRDYPRSGPPKRVPECHYRCMDEAKAENDELTASALKDILTMKFGVANVKYSVKTIARLRKELG